MAKQKKSWNERLAFSSSSAALFLKNLPFVLFLATLVMVYIANTLYSEKKVRQIQLLEQELKEMRWHYIQLKSNLMYNGKRTEVVKQVDDLGMKPPSGYINKIVVEKEK